jgi:hypothetical protein
VSEIQTYPLRTLLRILFRHDLSDTIVADLLSVSGYRNSTAAPVPDSLLVNGVGVYNCSDTTDTCTTRTIPDVRVLPNKKYRFRVINHSSHGVYDIVLAYFISMCLF